jgi:thymidylate kinase
MYTAIIPFLLALIAKHPHSTPIVHIEGIMGSGKSTLINYIDENLSHQNINHQIIHEPTEIWTRLNWTTLESRQQSQVFILYHMNHLLLQALQNKNDIIIMDRSPWSVCNVFMKLEHIDSFSVKLCSLGDLTNYIIYQSISPRRAHKRLSKRNREGDVQIPLSYLQLQNKLFNRANIATKASLIIDQ